MEYKVSYEEVESRNPKESRAQPRPQISNRKRNKNKVYTRWNQQFDLHTAPQIAGDKRLWQMDDSDWEEEIPVNIRQLGEGVFPGSSVQKLKDCGDWTWKKVEELGEAKSVVAGQQHPVRQVCAICTCLEMKRKQAWDKLGEVWSCRGLRRQAFRVAVMVTLAMAMAVVAVMTYFSKLGFA